MLPFALVVPIFVVAVDVSDADAVVVSGVTGVAGALSATVTALFVVCTFEFDTGTVKMGGCVASESTVNADSAGQGNEVTVDNVFDTGDGADVDRMGAIAATGRIGIGIVVDEFGFEVIDRFVDCCTG